MRDTKGVSEESAVDLVMRIDMIITTGRETGRYSEQPLVRTLRLSPHQANHGYLTRLLPGLFLPVCPVRTAVEKSSLRRSANGRARLLTTRFRIKNIRQLFQALRQPWTQSAHQQRRIELDDPPAPRCASGRQNRIFPEQRCTRRITTQCAVGKHQHIRIKAHQRLVRKRLVSGYGSPGCVLRRVAVTNQRQCPCRRSAVFRPRARVTATRPERAASIAPW